MIKLKENGKKSWNFKITKRSNGKPLELDLDLGSSSLTNRFNVVKNVLEDISECIHGFDTWYFDLIKEYIESNYDSKIILENLENFKEFANLYIDHKNIDYSEFIDLKKVSKTSILFTEYDIKDIIVASTCLKLYAIFQYDNNISVPDNVNKEVYNYFLQDCTVNKVTDKIFELIKARIYLSSPSNRFIWDLVKLTTLEDEETSIMTVFNFLMSNLLSLLEYDKNPVNYIITVANDSIKWMLKEIYKEKIIYDETVAQTEDIYSSSTKNVFLLYCCNDVVSKCAVAGLKLIEEQNSLDYDSFMELNDRINSIVVIDPVMKLFTIPIISKILDIPYQYLLAAPPKYITIIGTFIYLISKDIFVSKYPILGELLLCYPEVSNFNIVKSSYKVRDIDSILNDKSTVFGINCKKLKYDIISPICGILSTSKKNLVSILDGRKIAKVSYNELEGDCIGFYSSLYSGKLDKLFSEISERVDQYL